MLRTPPTTHSHDGTAFTVLTQDNLANNCGTYGDWITLKEGTYALGDDIEVENLAINSDVTLCLNGYTLSTPDTQYFTLYQLDGTLTICDCSEAESRGTIERFNQSGGTSTATNVIFGDYVSTMGDSSSATGCKITNARISAMTTTCTFTDCTIENITTTYDVLSTVSLINCTTQSICHYDGTIRVSGGTHVNIELNYNQNTSFSLDGDVMVSGCISVFENDINFTLGSNFNGKSSENNKYIKICGHMGYLTLNTETALIDGGVTQANAYFVYDTSKQYALPDGATQCLFLVNDGKLYVKPAYIHTHDNTFFTAWDGKSNITADGNYVLTADVADGPDVDVSGNVTICLNGHELSQTRLSVQENATVTLCDCSVDKSGYLCDVFLNAKNITISLNEVNVGGLISRASASVSTK